MLKQKINPEYKIDFKDFILNIKKHFKNNNNSIHKARNEIKILTHTNQNVVVKSFKIPHFINKIVYSFFRESKAKKSYDYSIKISNFVPKPIGYIEFEKSGLINESYFISEHFNYDFTIREPLLDNNFPEKKEILEAFSKFTFELHENKILHQDYSPGNILIKKENDKFIFKIVDINRMQFKTLSLDERLKNFSKLWISDTDITIVADKYAELLNADKSLCLDTALKYSRKHKNKINMKKRLKGIEVVD